MRGAYRKRWIEQPPNVTFFKPGGVPRRMLKTITLAVDEYEAIRLADYKGLDHLQAAEKMAISRPTFTRLIDKARQKIAMAIVDGMELVVEGGNIEFRNSRRRCMDCGEELIRPVHKEMKDCPQCGSENIEDNAQKFISSEPKMKSSKKGGITE